VVTANIRATRMELLNYRKRLKLAERGYKLLKDKRDKLMANLYPLLGEEGRKRKDAEEKLACVYRLMTIAKSRMVEKELKGTFPYAKVEIDFKHENLFGIMIPRIDYKIEEREDYSLATLPICAEDAVNGFKSIVKDLMELTELEAKCELLAMEIEKTKRRVNALEHVLIPEITANIRYIEMKIEEMERSETVNRIKMKEMKKV
jgi:V/A-type H+-transporting ATPase subunit D